MLCVWLCVWLCDTYPGGAHGKEDAHARGQARHEGHQIERVVEHGIVVTFAACQEAAVDLFDRYRRVRESEEEEENECLTLSIKANAVHTCRTSEFVTVLYMSST
jgi:hypothetical protein